MDFWKFHSTYFPILLPHFHKTSVPFYFCIFTSSDSRSPSHDSASQQSWGTMYSPTLQTHECDALSYVIALPELNARQLLAAVAVNFTTEIKDRGVVWRVGFLPAFALSGIFYTPLCILLASNKTCTRNRISLPILFFLIVNYQRMLFPSHQHRLVYLSVILLSIGNAEETLMGNFAAKWIGYIN